MNVGLTYNLKTEVQEDYGHKIEKGVDDWLEEYDSEATVAVLASAIESGGHKVYRVGYGTRAIKRLLDLKDVLDIVFNIAEGVNGRGRESFVPALLEMIDLKVVGADAVCLGVALDKNLCKQIARAIGVHTPDWYVSKYGDVSVAEKNIGIPVVTKLVHEGSSKGMRDRSILCYKEQSTMNNVQYLKETYKEDVLVEKFISGDEYTVGVVGDDLFGVMRIEPVVPINDFVYSVEVKRNFHKLVRYALLTEGVLYDKLCAMSMAMYREIGCRDFCRIDFRVEGEVPYFIEMNPLAGLNPETSDLVIMAKLQKISHRELVLKILDSAVRRHSS